MMKRLAWLVAIAAVVTCGIVVAARPAARSTKLYVCGRQGDVLILVERRAECVGDSKVIAGARVTLAHTVPRGRDE